VLAQMGDAAVVTPSAPNGPRLAISTDSFTVTPLFFPGGDIGKLAVHGTLNHARRRGTPSLPPLPIWRFRRVAVSWCSGRLSIGTMIVNSMVAVHHRTSAAPLLFLPVSITMNAWACGLEWRSMSARDHGDHGTR
jgi:hydrogenase expression/formation protein HypE